MPSYDYGSAGSVQPDQEHNSTGNNSNAAPSRGHHSGRPPPGPWKSGNKSRRSNTNNSTTSTAATNTRQRRISKSEILIRSKTSLERLFGRHRGQLLRFCFSIPFVTLGLCALACYLFTRGWIRMVSYLGLEQRVRLLRNKLKQATTVEEYEAIAKELDKVSGCQAWKLEPKSSCYDWKRVGIWTEALRQYRRSGRTLRLCEALATIQHLKFGRVFTEDCYSRCHWGTKIAIEEFLEELYRSLETVLEYLSVDRSCSNTENISNESKDSNHDEILKFVADFSSRWGNTALFLSGGGMIGFHHFGVGKALVQTKLIPRIIVGCSAGSAVAAWLATRTEDDLEKELDGHLFARLFTPFESISLWAKIMNFIWMGHMCTKESWIKCARRIYADCTMLESYQKTGRILNISASRADEDNNCSSGSYILNYKSAPNVLLISAILASSAFPLLSAPFPLTEKTGTGDTVPSTRFSSILFRDGCLAGDIPVQQISREFDVGFSIVTQVNPHVYPFLGLQSGSRAGRPARKQLMKRGGSLLGTLGRMESFFREVMSSILRLGITLDVWPYIKGVSTPLLYDQTYHGDVTLLPRRIFWIHRLAATNIARETDVQTYLNEGMIMMFEKVPLIRSRMKIDTVVDRLRERMATLVGEVPFFRDKGRTTTSQSVWSVRKRSSSLVNDVFSLDNANNPSNISVERSKDVTVYQSSIGEPAIESRPTVLGDFHSDDDDDDEKNNNKMRLVQSPFSTSSISIVEDETQKHPESLLRRSTVDAKPANTPALTKTQRRNQRRKRVRERYSKTHSNIENEITNMS